MPKVGLSRPYVARYHENGAGTVSYTDGVRAGRAVSYSFSLNATGSDNTFRCDNEVGESASGVFSGGNLSWTVAELDGTEYHIDTTWGDSGPSPDYGYFAMTPEESWQHHSW